MICCNCGYLYANAFPTKRQERRSGYIDHGHPLQNLTFPDEIPHPANRVFCPRHKMTEEGRQR